MGQADLEINRKARKVFVKHWIDLGNISLRSINGSLTIRGTLMKIFGQNEELSSPVVESIFNDINRIQGVSRLRTEIDNWTNAAGLWQPVNKEKDKHLYRSNSGGKQKDAYVIDDE